jgi:hypothetical protein
LNFQNFNNKKNKKEKKVTTINSLKTDVKKDVKTIVNKSNDFGAPWLKFGLRSDQKEVRSIVNAINEVVLKAKEGDRVKTRQFELKGKCPLYKYAIIDLEGEPPKFFGLLVSNQVYQLFVTKTKYLLDLYETVWQILNKLIDFYLFSFSNYEARFFKKILPFKLKEVNDKTFFQVLKIVNVQKRTFEGLVPALYSLNERSYHDPLLRNSKNIEVHFKNRDYYLIMEHNKSCLLSTLKIVQKRYLKFHLI